MKIISLILFIAGAVLSILTYILKLQYLLFPILALFLALIVLFFIKEYSKEKPSQVSGEEEEKDTIQKKIDDVSQFINSMIKEKQIDLRSQLGEIDEPVSLKKSINYLLTTLEQLVEWTLEKAEKLSIFSAEINFYTKESQQKSENQIKYAEEIIELMHNFLTSFNEIVEHGQKAFKITDEANVTYQHGEEMMDKTADTVKQLESFISYNNTYLQDLQAFTREMEKILKVIIDMAQKTNMLSLNASIEAARVGEKGKGFKVIATEIQKFSAKTTEASKTITSNIRELNKKMKKSFEMVDRSQGIVNSVMDDTNTLKTIFNSLSGYIGQSLKSTEYINDIAQKKLNEVTSIDQKVTGIQKTISDFKDDFGYVSKSAEDITKSSEEILRLVNHFDIDNFPTAARHVMTDISKKMGRVLEEKVEQNILTKQDLFDSNYQEIPDTNPQKYHTVYDTLVDTQLQDLLEEMATRLRECAEKYKKEIRGGIVIDRNGYAPIHMRAASEEPTGDYDYDLIRSRHKRIFSDPISQKAAKNTSEFLFQIYMADIGALHIDLAVPIFVLGEHWGCVRLAYHFEE